MAQNKTEKNMWAIKSAVGSLFKAVTLSTDPAQTLSFSASLVNTTRAYLIQKLEDKVPDSEAIPSAMGSILHIMIKDWTDKGISKQSIKTMDERIDAIFGGSESMTRYGLTLYRDALYCDDLQKRWKIANQTYIQSPAAWALSNEELANINKQLMEIIVRHDLMTFPKGELFNLDGSSMSSITKRMMSESES